MDKNNTSAIDKALWCLVGIGNRYTNKDNFYSELFERHPKGLTGQKIFDMRKNKKAEETPYPYHDNT